MRKPLVYYPDHSCADQTNALLAGSLAALLAGLGVGTKAKIVLSDSASGGTTYTFGAIANYSAYTLVTIARESNVTIAHGAYALTLPNFINEDSSNPFTGAGAVAYTDAAPTATVVTANDIEITDATKGIIRVDTGGVRWRETQNTDGTVTRTPL